MAAEIKVIDNTFYSVGFPNTDWNTLINRSNYLSQIEEEFDSDISLFFIEGEEDVGKTMLVSQFAKKYSAQTISVFFNPRSSLDYQIDYFCLNIVLQAKNILKEENIDTNELISTEQYRHYLYQLRKGGKKRKADRINIIIDGLEDKVKEDLEFVRSLLQIIPFGEDRFRIIITGLKSDFVSINQKLKREDAKSIKLSGFSEPEIIKFLNLESFETQEMRDLYKTTKGYPGRLKTLKRLIAKEGNSLEKVLQNSTYSVWLEMDCDSLDLSLPLNSVLISLLSLSEQSFNKEELAKICSVELPVLEQAIATLSVLECGKTVNIISNAHKRYLANILRGNKAKIEELLINYYAGNESLSAMIELPKLFSNKKEWGKVIDLLDERYFQKVLEGTGSVKTVNETLELGVTASQNASRYTDLWRYSIEGSIVNELDNYLFWESEIEARIALKDFVGAISLAESAIVLVDRLRLLALIARRQKEFSNKVDEVLIVLIQDLYKIIDLTSVGKKIYDIVADLIYAIPNLAIEMIERSSGSLGSNSSNINDWVIAKLSIAAIDSSIKDSESLENSKKLEAVQNLNNPSVRKINRAISFLVGNYTATKVLEEVRKIQDVEERLKLLRLWLANNKADADDLDIVLHKALDELIGLSSETSITLEVLSELSTQLPFIRDKSKKLKIYQRFKSIDRDVTDLGLTRNKYVYLLNMFHAEFVLDRQKAVKSINKVISEIDSIGDTLIKLDAYAETYSNLCFVKDETIVKKINFVYSRIFQLSGELTNLTASHYKVFKDCLKVIAKRRPKLALKIIEGLNTRTRRERARILVLDSYLDNSLRRIDIDHVRAIEDSLEQTFTKEILCQRVLDRFAESKGLSFKVILLLTYFGKKIETIQNPLERISAFISYYKIISRNEDWKKKLSQKVENQLYNNWKKLDADWEKIDFGFRICYELASLIPDFSKKVFEESEGIKSKSWLDSHSVAYTYLNSIKLIIKSYAALVQCSTNTNEDYKVLEDLIAGVPSEIEKLRLWTEVGFNAVQAQNENLFALVMNDHVIHLIHDLIAKKIDLQDALDSLTLIHEFNPELAKNYIAKISSDLHEGVYSSICHFYITKQSPFEMYETRYFKYSSSFSDLTKAIGALSMMKVDTFIYSQIKHLCEAIHANRNLSKPQISTLLEDLKRIVEHKFPDAQNIKHEGFKIIAESKVSSLNRTAINHNTYWTDLIKRSNVISNHSDGIFVKSVLLEDIPFDKITNGLEVKKSLHEDVIKMLDSMVIHYEYAQRVIDISDIMYPIDKTGWKKMVGKAFTISSNLNDGPDTYTAQKNIIDSMHRLDPAYAKELIKQIDKDNANNKINKLLLKHYATLEISDKIKNNKTLEQKEKENHDAIVGSVIMALKGLNSDRIASKKINEAAGYLPLGNKMPLHEVFPVYVYYLQNCLKTYKNAKDGNVATLHRDNFRQAVKATNLIQILSQRKKSHEKTYRKFFIDEEFVSNQAVHPKSREAAFNFIKTWLEEQSEEFILIADPYFEKEDLEILKIIKEVNDTLEIDILGSVDGKKGASESDYKSYWRSISDQNPPFTNLTFCWTEDSSDTPFHDRWVITKNSGLRIGTSINSLGIKKESEISIMKPNEALKIRENTLLEFVLRRKKEFNNQRVRYNGFSL